MIKSFRDSKIRPQFLWLLFLTAALALSVFILRPGAVVVSQQAGPLFEGFLWLTGRNPVFLRIIAILLITGTGFFLNEMLKIFRAVPRNSYIVLLFWLILYALHPGLWPLSPVMTANFLIIFAFFSLFRSAIRSNDEDLSLAGLINAGLLFSLAALFYKPLVITSVLLIFILIILRRFSLQSLLVLMFSFSVPYLYYAVYLYFTEDTIQIFPAILQLNIGHYVAGWISDYHNYLPLTALLLLGGRAAFHFMSGLAANLIEIRIINFVFIAYLLGVLFVLLTFSSVFWQEVALLFPPLAAILGMSSLTIKNTRPADIVLWSVLIVSFVLPQIS